LKALPAVIHCGEIENGWDLGTTDVTASIAALMRRIEADGNELRDLQIRRPSLEDVFIELTGSRLGDV